MRKHLIIIKSKTLLANFWGCGLSVTERILVTLRTWVRSATILAQASQQATTPISTRFLLSSRKVCDFLQEGYLSPIVFARLESPTSKQFFLLPTSSESQSSYKISYRGRDDINRVSSLWPVHPPQQPGSNWTCSLWGLQIKQIYLIDWLLVDERIDSHSFCSLWLISWLTGRGQASVCSQDQLSFFSCWERMIN